MVSAGLPPCTRRLDIRHFDLDLVATVHAHPVCRLKGHAGLLDLIFYSVSQHTIRQSAASDPCNLNIASGGCVGLCRRGASA